MRGEIYDGIRIERLPFDAVHVPPAAPPSVTAVLRRAGHRAGARGGGGVRPATADRTRSVFANRGGDPRGRLLEWDGPPARGRRAAGAPSTGWDVARGDGLAADKRVRQIHQGPREVR